MPDRVIAGEAPPANAGTYSPGTVWMRLTERAADVTGKTIGVEVWSTNMCRYLGINFAGPGREQHGGPFLVKVEPTAWAAAPVYPAPGKVLIADQVLPHPNFYRFEVQCSEVRTHLDVQVGRPGVEQMGPDLDAEKVLQNTHAGRMAQERLNIRDMQRPTPILGSPKQKTRQVSR